MSPADSRQQKTEAQSKRLQVQICSIDMRPSLPYQWTLLKTYAEQDPLILDGVEWPEAMHFDVRQVRKLLKNSLQFVREFNLTTLDVLGISVYNWNFTEQMDIARLVREQNPDCLIVAGGPEINHRDASFFEKHPYVDLIVKKDGEIPFRKILAERLRGGLDYASIAGLIVRGPAGPRDTGPTELLANFDLSPWLSQKQRLIDWAARRSRTSSPLSATLESNRGCPYSCTFCNWGSNTMSRIRSFKIENIHQELVFFNQLGITELWLADANFGIFERDLEICKSLSVLNSNDRKCSVVIFAAKNHVENVLKIAVSMHQDGLANGFYLGIQTTHPASLAAIGRSNMSFDKYEKLSLELGKHKIPLIPQIILGCPGETPESWRKTMLDTLSLGFKVQIFPFQVLPNTPAAAPEYRER